MESLDDILSRGDSKMKGLREYAEERAIAVMLPQSERLLAVLTMCKQPKRILEIGTAIGYSGILMLSRSEGARLNTIEYNEASAAVAATNFEKYGFKDKVHLFVGDAREIVPMLTGSYDFVFMDGPKGQYIEFLPYIMELLEVGGVLVCDNVLFRGLVLNQPDKRHRKITIARNLHSFIEALISDERLESTVLDVGDGISVSVKKQ
ncbi:MAG: O-methyltransferase [Clostridia bacterium]|nr:O-methyltransferase [Clostridia bacterium]